jgi:hypothetical protein
MAFNGLRYTVSFSCSSYVSRKKQLPDHAEGYVANWSLCADDTNQLLWAGVVLLLLPLDVKLLVMSLTYVDSSATVKWCIGTLRYVCPVTMGCIAFSLYNAPKLYKTSLKAYSGIIGVPVSPFTAISIAMKLLMLGLIYPVLRLTKCNELAEHMIEGVWPIQHTAADKLSRIFTTTYTIERCASDTAILIWTVLWAIASKQACLEVGPVLIETYVELSEWWSS